LLLSGVEDGPWPTRIALLADGPQSLGGVEDIARFVKRFLPSAKACEEDDLPSIWSTLMSDQTTIWPGADNHLWPVRGWKMDGHWPRL